MQDSLVEDQSSAQPPNSEDDRQMLNKSIQEMQVREILSQWEAGWHIPILLWKRVV
jgi:hypothetical protein